METQGSRIKKLRAKAGITQTALAKRVGVTEGQTVSRWEREETQPSDENLVRLAEFFGVTKLWLEYGVAVPEATSEPIHDEEAPVIDRAIRYVFGASWPPPELEKRIRSRAELTGFNTGGDLGMLAGLVERTRDEWKTEQSGMPPKTKEAPATVVDVGDLPKVPGKKPRRT